MPRSLRELHGQIVWIGPRLLPGVKMNFGFAQAPEVHGPTFGRRIVAELQLVDGTAINLVSKNDLNLAAIGISPIGMGGFENQFRAVLARVQQLEVVHAGAERDFAFTMRFEPCDDTPDGAVLTWRWPSAHETRCTPSAAFAAPGKGSCYAATLAEIYPVIPAEQQAA